MHLSLSFSPVRGSSSWGLQCDACSAEKAPYPCKLYTASLEQTIFAAPKNQRYCTVSSEEETMVK